MIGTSRPRLVRQSVMTCRASAAWGQSGAVRSSIRMRSLLSGGNCCGGSGLDVAQDRAVTPSAGLITGVDQPGQCVTHAGEGLDAVLHVGDANAGHRLGVVTGGGPTVGQVQQFLDVIEGEAELLGTLDE